MMVQLQHFCVAVFLCNYKLFFMKKEYQDALEEYIEKVRETYIYDNETVSDIDIFDRDELYNIDYFRGITAMSVLTSMSELSNLFAILFI